MSATEPPKRRGWQLPGQESSLESTSTEAAEPQQDLSPAEKAGGLEPTPTMRGSVLGQVTDVEKSTLQRGEANDPIVTLRLERNDPHEGRTFVATVRLEGGEALGFADRGDWIEAVGKSKSAYLIARRCINHTTGAVYGTTGRRALKVLRVILVILLLGGFALFALNMFNSYSRQKAQMVSLCEQSGAPREMCQ